MRINLLQYIGGNSYLSQADAVNTYLSQTDAANTYLSQDDVTSNGRISIYDSLNTKIWSS